MAKFTATVSLRIDHADGSSSTYELSRHKSDGDNPAFFADLAASIIESTGAEVVEAIRR